MTESTYKCQHKTLKRQVSGSVAWYVCANPDCDAPKVKGTPQKFKAVPWDGKIQVVDGGGQAALASAGTSGTADAEYDQKSCDVIMNLSMLVRRLCARLHKHEPDAKMIDQALGYLRGEGLQGSLLRGDSLSGKGEATNKFQGGVAQRSASDSGATGADAVRLGVGVVSESPALNSPSAPDRAEELAREIVQSLPLTRQPMATDVEKVASLLRREMGRWTNDDLYDAYLRGCEDDAIPEPLDKQTFLASWEDVQDVQ